MLLPCLAGLCDVGWRALPDRSPVGTDGLDVGVWAVVLAVWCGDALDGWEDFSSKPPGGCFATTAHGVSPCLESLLLVGDKLLAERCFRRLKFVCPCSAGRERGRPCSADLFFQSGGVGVAAAILLLEFTKSTHKIAKFADLVSSHGGVCRLEFLGLGKGGMTSFRPAARGSFEGPVEHLKLLESRFNVVVE